MIKPMRVGVMCDGLDDAWQYFDGGKRETYVAPLNGASALRVMRYVRELTPESKKRFREVLRADIPELRKKKTRSACSTACL